MEAKFLSPYEEKFQRSPHFANLPHGVTRQEAPQSTTQNYKQINAFYVYISSGDHGGCLLFTALLAKTRSACSLIPLRTTCLGVALPTVILALSHQSLVREMLYRLAYRPTVGVFSQFRFFFFFFQKTFASLKVTKTSLNN